MPQISAVNAIPKMTSNTTPSGIAKASVIYSSSNDAWKAFDGSTSGYWGTTRVDSNPAWISYTFAAPIIISAYKITPQSNPRGWRFEGSNNEIDWDVLDTQDSWSGVQYYQFNNLKAYKTYRLYVTKSATNAYVEIKELEMYELIYINKFLLLSDGKIYSFKIIPGEKNETLTSNVGVTAIASASNESSGAYGAWRVFDGGLGETRRWTTTNSNQGAPQWVKYSIKDEKKSLKKYSVYAGGSRQPTAWRLEGSNDETNWDILDEVSGLKDVTDYTILYEKEFVSLKSYIHYRLYLTAQLSSGYIELGEVELYFEDVLELYEISNTTERSFVNYGSTSVKSLNQVFLNKRYVLQNTTNEDPKLVLNMKLNRKPLSIQFN